MKPNADASSRGAPNPSSKRNTPPSSQPTTTTTSSPAPPNEQLKQEKRSLPMQLLHLPLLLLQLLSALLSKLSFRNNPSNNNTHNSQYEGYEVFRNESSSITEIFTPFSPALTTLLDMALYRANEAELVHTACAASGLLSVFLEMKECSALILRECRWMTGVPFTPLEVEDGVAVGRGGVVLEKDAVASDEKEEDIDDGVMGSEEARWNEYEMIQDFALQCFGVAKEAIQRLSTDRLAESANLTLADVISSVGEEGKKEDNLEQISPGSDVDGRSMLQQGVSFNLTDAEIGRCYKSQPRSSCWESTRLYCPDYSWADDCITSCQRLIRNLSKHKFVTSVGSVHGWNRYVTTPSEEHSNVIYPPECASNSPHPFPSLEAIHALKYLVLDLLSTSLPSHLNQFRAAVESNAVVSKRLYLVKCEYRAPIRAHMESWMALKAAPKLELVERYLKEFHGVTGEGDTNSNRPTLQRSNSSKRKNNSSSSAEPLALHKQRDSLEKIIADQWKHPSFLDALQMERLCERLEMEMSQILLPLSHLAAEIMDQLKGRIRAVALLTNDSEENGDNDDESVELNIEEILGWKDIPHMRELLKCLKTILCRKPGPGESTGIRPLLLDLQGVPRKNDDVVDVSVEVSFYKPLPETKTSFFSSLSSRDTATKDKWYYLEQFIERVEILLKLISQAGSPFLIGNSQSNKRWNELIQNCTEVWDAELFRAQYQDWFDMVTRQNNLNSTTDGGSLSQISETIREAEIELSIAMASASQLELVRQRLEALLADKNARYMVMAQIVNDVALRELNENIVVLPATKDMSTDFPKLSPLGLFGNQLLMSKETLPI